jgi:hypothetical protein
VKGPGGWSSQPITADAATRDRAAKLPTATYWQCPAGPFCQGPGSADWAECDARCKGCQPPAPPRPIMRENLS